MDWNTIRDEFPVTRSGTFLDHARVAPLPGRVRGAIRAFADDACENGTAGYEGWMAHNEQVRERFARLIGARSEEVAFVKNTSEGLSFIAGGLDWKAGDNVVIPDIEFPANVYPWLNLAGKGVETRFVAARDGCVLFEDIAARVDSRTRLISISSVEFHSGFRNDLGRIGAFCRERGILFAVDAIQSLGALPMDVERDHIDFLAADGHKWLLSVEGLGGLYVSSRVLDKVHPVLVGWDSVVHAADFLTYDFTLRPGAKRFEEGSFNTLSIHAFGAALTLFLEIGMDRIEARILALGDAIIAGLEKRNLAIKSSTRPGERSGIVSFLPRGNADDLGRFMHENGVTLTVRGGRVRVSPHFYNNLDDVGHFFDVLDRYLKQAG